MLWIIRNILRPLVPKATVLGTLNVYASKLWAVVFWIPCLFGRLLCVSVNSHDSATKNPNVIYCMNLLNNISDVDAGFENCKFSFQYHNYSWFKLCTYTHRETHTLRL